VTDVRIERGNGPKNQGWSRAYLYLGASLDAEVDVDLPDAVFDALAAAIDDRGRLRQSLESADADRVRLLKEVHNLEARNAQVDITAYGDAGRRIHCNACGNIRIEPREGR
jgi:hypothetical protein